MKFAFTVCNIFSFIMALKMVCVNFWYTKIFPFFYSLICILFFFGLVKLNIFLCLLLFPVVLPFSFYSHSLPYSFSPYLLIFVKSLSEFGRRIIHCINITLFFYCTYLYSLPVIFSSLANLLPSLYVRC